MQLLFTLEEIKLLIALLEAHSEHAAAAEQQFIEDALDELVGRHPQFAADQLDQLAEIIAAADAELRTQIDRAATPTSSALQVQRERLSRVRDKVQEACAMA